MPHLVCSAHHWLTRMTGGCHSLGGVVVTGAGAGPRSPGRPDNFALAAAIICLKALFEVARAVTAEAILLVNNSALFDPSQTLALTSAGKVAAIFAKSVLAVLGSARSARAAS